MKTTRRSFSQAIAHGMAQYPNAVDHLTAPRLYHLIVRTSAGGVVYLTRYPMSHEQCRIVASKQSDTTRPRVEFLET